MNTEELYIWDYGIGKLPKGLLEYGRFDVCDTYDESKRQKFQNHGQWMWKNKNDEWRENLPPLLYLVCNKKPGILQFDFCDQQSIKLKIVSEEFLSLLQENGFVDKYDIATVKVVNKKNESLTDKKYYALRINHFDNDSFHFGKGITYQTDFQKKLGVYSTVYPDMKLKDNSIKQNFFVLNSKEYRDSIIFRERVLDKVLNLYKPEIYKLSDYSLIWDNREHYPYGNELMIVK